MDNSISTPIVVVSRKNNKLSFEQRFVEDKAEPRWIPINIAVQGQKVNTSIVSWLSPGQELGFAENLPSVTPNEWFLINIENSCKIEETLDSI